MAANLPAPSGLDKEQIFGMAEKEMECRVELFNNYPTLTEQHPNSHSATAVVAVLLSGTGVIGSDGQTTVSRNITDYMRAFGATPDNTGNDNGNKMFCIKDFVFGSFSGRIRDVSWIVKHVRNQIEKVPVQSTQEIAAVFVYWCNAMFATMTKEAQERVEDDEDIPNFILLGRLQNEHGLRLIKIFPFDNDKPAMKKANASNFFSLPVCDGVTSAGPYVAHAQTVCSIGSGSKKALDFLRRLREIPGPNMIQKVVKRAVIEGTTGGKINMITLSGGDAPVFHTASPYGDDGTGCLRYGEPVTGDFVPYGYQEQESGEEERESH